MRLASQHRYPRRPRASAAPVGIQVIEQPGGRLAEQGMPVRERIREIRLHGYRWWVRVEGVEAVAEAFLRLAHHGGAADPAERIEGHCGPVPVGVADQARR